MSTRQAIFLALCAIGCAGDGASPGPGDPIEQFEFDLTFQGDRDYFVEDGLSYVASVGPYAIYEVTSATPRLLGPVLHFQRAPSAWGMLCGAAGYFSDDPAATGITARLYGGPRGDETFVTARMGPTGVGGCASAQDDFGEKLPPSDDPADPGDGSTDPGYDTIEQGDEQLVVDVEAAPTGSWILLRRIALATERPGHNDSHVIQRVCCNTTECGLGEPPADEPGDGSGGGSPIP